MTKLGVNPPTEGAAEDKKDKDIEKDPKIFTVVQPCPQMVPVQMPPFPEARKKKTGSLCGLLLRIALISILFALFAVALVIAFSGHDGLKGLFGQERTVILVPEKITLNEELKQQQKEAIEAQKIAIVAIPSETSDEEHEEMERAGPEEPEPESENEVDEGIEGNEESVPDEEKPGAPEIPSQMIEGGNTPDLATIWEMRRQQAMRMWRLKRIQQALFQQQLMKEMVARALMQAMAQHAEATQHENEERLAHWQQMHMARLQQQWQQRGEQEQEWRQQQMAWANQPQTPEFWPQPQHVLFRQNWANQQQQQQQEEQQRWAAYWEGQRRQQEAEMQRRQWMQFQWAQQQQAAQAEAEARAREQEERMKAWQQAQQQWQAQQQMQQAMAIAQQQQQMQMQAQQQQQRPQQPPQVPPQQQGQEAVPLRPHDASAQQIVNQLQAQPQPAIPSVEDRVYQHFQQIAQGFNSGAGFRPTFSAVPVDEREQAQTEDIYNEMLRKALAMREQEAPATTVATKVEKTTEPVVIEDSFPKLNEAKTVEEGDEKTENDSNESESVPDEEKADPLAEFFRFFENEAQKMGEQPAQFNTEKKDDTPMPTPAPLAVDDAEVDAAEPHIVETTKTQKTDTAAQTEEAPQESEVEPPKSSADLGAPVPIPITSAATA